MWERLVRGVQSRLKKLNRGEEQSPGGSAADPESGGSSVDIHREMRKWNSVERQHSDRPPVGRDRKVLPDSGIISTSPVGEGRWGSGGGFNSHPSACLAVIGRQERQKKKTMLRSRPLIAG